MTALSPLLSLSLPLSLSLLLSLSFSLSAPYQPVGHVHTPGEFMREQIVSQAAGTGLAKIWRSRRTPGPYVGQMRPRVCYADRVRAAQTHFHTPPLHPVSHSGRSKVKEPMLKRLCRPCCCRLHATALLASCFLLMRRPSSRPL